MIENEDGIDKVAETFDVISKIDLVTMMATYKEMVSYWVSEVNLRLSRNIACPIELFNEVRSAYEHLKNIQAYQSQIDLCSILQGVAEV